MVYVKVVDGFTNLVPRFAGYFFEEKDVGPGNEVDDLHLFEKFHFIPLFKIYKKKVKRY